MALQSSRIRVSGQVSPRERELLFPERDAVAGIRKQAGSEHAGEQDPLNIRVHRGAHRRARCRQAGMTNELFGEYAPRIKPQLGNASARSFDRVARNDSDSDRARFRSILQANAVSRLAN